MLAARVGLLASARGGVAAAAGLGGRAGLAGARTPACPARGLAVIRGAEEVRHVAAGGAPVRNFAGGSDKPRSRVMQRKLAREERERQDEYAVVERRRDDAVGEPIHYEEPPQQPGLGSVRDGRRAAPPFPRMHASAS